MSLLRRSIILKYKVYEEFSCLSDYMLLESIKTERLQNYLECYTQYNVFIYFYYISFRCLILQFNISIHYRMISTTSLDTINHTVTNFTHTQFPSSLVTANLFSVSMRGFFLFVCLFVFYFVCSFSLHLAFCGSIQILELFLLVPGNMPLVF